MAASGTQTAGTVADKAAVEDATRRQALIEQIAANYDNLDEQAAAAEALGIDPNEMSSAALRMPDNPEAAESPSIPRMGDMDGAIEDVFKAAPAPEDASVAARQQAAPEEDIQAQLEAANMKVAELTAQQNMPADEQFRKEALESFKADVAKIEEANRADDEELKAIREEDPDLAEKFEKKVNEAKAMRAEALEAKITSRVDANKQAYVEIQRTEAELEVALTANPELKQWRDDAKAAEAGVPGKDGTMYKMALAMDKALAENPAYLAKSATQRFAHLITTVKAATGAPTPGTPSAPTRTATSRAVREIVSQRSAAPRPQSLSEMPGSTQPPTSALAQLDDLTEANLHDMMNRSQGALTVEMMDHLSAQLDEQDL